MAGPLYIADPESAVRSVELDGLTALYHAPSGMTHIVAPPAPQILDALRQGPADLEELLRRLSRNFDFKPSPLMGEDEQVAMPPRHGFGSRGDPNLSMVGVNVNEGRGLSGDSTSPQALPIEGRGFELDALHARLDELETAGLVRRA